MLHFQVAFDNKIIEFSHNFRGLQIFGRLLHIPLVLERLSYEF